MGRCWLLADRSGHSFTLDRSSQSTVTYTRPTGVNAQSRLDCDTPQVAVPPILNAIDFAPARTRRQQQTAQVCPVSLSESPSRSVGPALAEAVTALSWTAASGASPESSARFCPSLIRVHCTWMSDRELAFADRLTQCLVIAKRPATPVSTGDGAREHRAFPPCPEKETARLNMVRGPAV